MDVFSYRGESIKVIQRERDAAWLVLSERCRSLMGWEAKVKTCFWI